MASGISAAAYWRYYPAILTFLGIPSSSYP